MNPETPQNDQTNNTGGRRRSSGFMPAFASLHEQKRGSDANVARRASMSDQEVKGGFLSQFFHKYVIELPILSSNLPSIVSNGNVDTFHSNFGRNAGK